MHLTEDLQLAHPCGELISSHPKRPPSPLPTDFPAERTIHTFNYSEKFAKTVDICSLHIPSTRRERGCLFTNDHSDAGFLSFPGHHSKGASGVAYIQPEMVPVLVWWCLCFWIGALWKFSLTRCGRGWVTCHVWDQVYSWLGLYLYPVPHL